MAERSLRTLTVDFSPYLLSLLRPLREAGISKASEMRMARVIREGLREQLFATIRDARIDGAFPIRTGTGYARTLQGVRAFGTTFNTLRGHIIAPLSIFSLEHGATITPTNAPQLAIPLPAALRPDGTPKLPGPSSWRNVLNTFIYKSKRTGKGYIAYKNATGRLTLLYVFVDSVEIKPRGFLSKAWIGRHDEMVQIIGLAMIAEFGTIDLLSIAGVTYRGRRTRSNG